MTKEVREFLEYHSARETYLFNNRLYFSGLISADEYSRNHSLIARGGVA